MQHVTDPGALVRGEVKTAFPVASVVPVAVPMTLPDQAMLTVAPDSGWQFWSWTVTAAVAR